MRLLRGTMRLSDKTNRGPRVALRVDGGPDVGLGHVMRLRAVARAIRRRGGTILAVGGGLSGERSIEEPWTVRPMPGFTSPKWTIASDASATRELIDVANPDVIITDNYALDSVWEQEVRAAFPQSRLVVFDDLSHRIHDADVIVDANLGDGGPGLMQGREGRVLSGTHYAPLDEEYRGPRTTESSDRQLSRVLVTLGGGASGIVPRLVEELIREPKLGGAAFTLVIPDDRERLEVVRAAGSRSGISIRARVPSLRPLVEEADLVVGAGGTSAWQRLRLGVPSVVVALADNQVRTCRELAAQGVAHWVEEARNPREIVAGVVSALGDCQLRERAAAVGPLLVDGQGADRIALLVAPPTHPPSLRLVHQNDAAALLGIANDPVTRLSSRRSSHITPDEHVAWFAKALELFGATFWVAEVDGLVVGHVRMEDLGGAWELSYGLDPLVRGSGWSRSLVEEAIRRARALRRLPIVAVASQSNIGSRRILETIGFHLDPFDGRAQEFGAEVPTGFAAYIFEG